MSEVFAKMRTHHLGRRFTEEDRKQHLKELLEDPWWDFQYQNISAVIRWYEEGGKLSREPHWFMDGKLRDSEPEPGTAIVWEEVYFEKPTQVS